MKTSGLLTRMSLAWSRDGDKKFYVQDRMREVGREVWTWLAEGAHVYICGDAKRMAKDVERALVDIVAQFGARSTDEAVRFVAELKKNGPVPAGRLLMTGFQFQSAQMERIKFSCESTRRIFVCESDSAKRPYRYFPASLAIRPRTVFHYARWGVGDRPCANCRRKPVFTFMRVRFRGGPEAGFHTAALLRRIRA